MYLDLSNKNLTDLPEYVYNNRTIRAIICNHNKLTNLDRLNELPKLEFLICHHNNLTELNNLPSSLEILNCSNNNITSINLPNKLKILECSNTSLPYNNLYDYQIYKFKLLYYKTKYSNRIERYYIKYRNKYINLELLYSPDLQFYKQFFSKHTLQYIKF